MTPIHICHSSWSLQDGHSTVGAHRTQFVYIVFDIRSISSWLPLIKYFGGWFGLKGSEQRMRTLGFIVLWSIFSPATDAIFGYAYVLKFERQLVITCIAEVDRDERMDYLYCHSTWGYFLLLLEGGLTCDKGQEEGDATEVCSLTPAWNIALTCSASQTPRDA